MDVKDGQEILGQPGVLPSEATPDRIVGEHVMPNPFAGGLERISEEADSKRKRGLEAKTIFVGDLVKVQKTRANVMARG
jgi:hypothetical protein